ncbi:hypothetical protein V7D15_13630, partial [Thermoanaerobacter thermohydrosulfuricus]
LLEYVKKTVTNKQLKKKHIREIDKAIKFLQCLECKPGRVLRPLDGTSFSPYDFWRVLKAAVVRPLSPEKVPRDCSALRELLMQGK